MAARTLATATSEGSLADLSDTVGPTGNTNDAGPSFWDAVLKPALQELNSAQKYPPRHNFTGIDFQCQR